MAGWMHLADQVQEQGNITYLTIHTFFTTMCMIHIVNVQVIIFICYCVCDSLVFYLALDCILLFID